MKPIIIAIDGYSSCGKSTLAKQLAVQLNYAYVDTGAMYRAVTLYFMRVNFDWNNSSEDELEKQLDAIDVRFKFNADKGISETFLNGENVEEEIRGKAVSNKVSAVSQIKAVRERMIRLQQKAGERKALVMDGRDIGTKVFPNAEAKIFMTAKPEIRAQRRFEELKAKGKSVSLEEVVENLKLRDHHDTVRRENPLIQAEDAFVIDNSDLDREAQFQIALDYVESKLN